MAEHNGVEHFLIAYAIGAGLDHCNQLIGRSDGNGHTGIGLLLGGRVYNIFTVDHADRNAAYRAFEGDLGNCNGDRRTYHTHHLGRAVGINRHNGANYRNVVAHILREKGTHGTVDNTGGEYCLLGRTTLAAHEGTGDTSYGVELLVKINRKGEEIDTLTGLCCHGCGAKHGRFTVASHAGTGGKLSELSGFYRKGTAGELH